MNFKTEARSAGFPLGTHVFYYHKMRGLDEKDILSHFRMLGKEAVVMLQPSMHVWIDLSPYNSPDSIRGFTKCLISKVERVESGTCLYFGRYQIAHTDNHQKKVCVVDDEPALMALALHCEYSVEHIRAP